MIAQAVNATLGARSLQATGTWPSPLIAPTATRVPTTTPLPSAPPAPAASPISLPTAGPAASATIGASPTLIPTIALTPTPRSTATLCPNCPLRPHYWLERPIGPDGVNYVDPTYRYGDTQNGAREPHHGVEFFNPEGTPLRAVANGTVVVAGNDWKEVYGRGLYFYGTLVVLQLDQRYRDQPVYALYGHLSELSVQVGQKVRTGDVIGKVGASGVALGPHLHLEVRVGKNDYYSTRNPELWLKPLNYNGTGWGGLAGIVRDTSGTPLSRHTVVIRSLNIDYDEPITKYVATYAEESLNGDDELRENFGIGDLPPGTYEVAVNTTKLYREVVVVAPGQLSFVQFTVNPVPPTPTPTP